MKERLANNIRELIGHLIGKRLIEITSEDEEERAAGKDSYVTLMFDDGNTLTFFIAKDSSAYVGNSPICLSDPDDRDQSFVDGYFHPTPAEREQHCWIAVTWRDATGTELHVVPTWTEDHILDEACWCKPVKKFRDDGTWYWEHNESGDGS